MRCALLLLFLLLGCVSGMPSTAIEYLHCEDGVIYQHQCNTCYCATTDLFCTHKQCPPPKESEECVTGTTWREKCNRCWCVKDMGVVCTAENCAENEVE